MGFIWKEGKSQFSNGMDETEETRANDFPRRENLK